MRSIEELWRDSQVAIVKPDLDKYSDVQIGRAVDHLCRELGWFSQEKGPFGQVIKKGDRVVIKPNFVMHRNQGPWDIEPLITHPSLVRAAVEAALQADPAEVIVGDAPLQSCDFDLLMQRTGLSQWSDDLMRRDPRFNGIRDFRRTTCSIVDGVRIASEDLQSQDDFILFDLAEESLLEEISDPRVPFRVTCYDPRLMSERHSKGKHQYLIAREIIEADVVINLPKLKTHKKAGMTCALKNLIGINGNKEYLPHHRVGGSGNGGDCYPGKSAMKTALEYALDQQNMARSALVGKLWSELSTNLNRILHVAGDTTGVEGSHSGNDTVWRTCLDLNRILLYGRNDATLGKNLQRKVIHLVDAVVAGQGNGPLSPEPLPAGVVFAGSNAAAIDWVGAELLGYDKTKLPLVREAFGHFRWPIADFDPDDVTVPDAVNNALMEYVPIIYPDGWKGAGRNSSV